MKTPEKTPAPTLQAFEQTTISSMSGQLTTR